MAESATINGEFLLRVFKAFNIHPDNFLADGKELMWRTDGEYAPLSLFVKCSDFFYWGCADSEDLTSENIHLLEVAMEDTAKAGLDTDDGLLLFCCRSRKLAPMKAWMRQCTSEWTEEQKNLFLNCGPQAE